MEGLKVRWPVNPKEEKLKAGSIFSNDPNEKVELTEELLNPEADMKFHDKSKFWIAGTSD